MTEKQYNHEPRATSHEPRATSHEPGVCPKFSIIVPAYNVEDYIAKALDSLINQDIPTRNYEIIITDDGSTDSTGTICDDYAQKFPFIHVTHTDNLGPSHARNTALPQCRGEYITFCDADDFVSPHLLSTITKIADTYNPDFITWLFFTDKELTAKGWPVYNEPQAVISDAEELCYRILLDNVIGGFSQTKALRREIIGSIKFDKSLSVCEDMEWFVRLLNGRENLRVCLTECQLYCYVHHPNIGQTRDTARLHTQDGFPRSLQALIKIVNIPGLDNRSSTLIKNRIYSQALAALWRRPVKQTPKVYAELRRLIRDYAADYYSSPAAPLWRKIAFIIVHVLVLFHVHQPHW